MSLGTSQYQSSPKKFKVCRSQPVVISTGEPLNNWCFLPTDRKRYESRIQAKNGDTENLFYFTIVIVELGSTIVIVELTFVFNIGELQTCHWGSDFSNSR